MGPFEQAVVCALSQILKCTQTFSSGTDEKMGHGVAKNHIDQVEPDRTKCCIWNEVNYFVPNWKCKQIAKM